MMSVEGCVFTHRHKANKAGMEDVRQYNLKQNADMPVYGTRNVHEQLKVEFYYAFEKVKYPGIPQLKLNEINDTPFEEKGVLFTPLPVMHLGMPVHGFRVGNFSYITDANRIPDLTLEKLKGTEVLVLNALQKEKHISHFNLEEAIAMAEKIGAAQTYFTHISHKLGLHNVVDKELPKRIALAYDGLVIRL